MVMPDIAARIAVIRFKLCRSSTAEANQTFTRIAENASRTTNTCNVLRSSILDLPEGRIDQHYATLLCGFRGECVDREVKKRRIVRVLPHVPFRSAQRKLGSYWCPTYAPPCRSAWWAQVAPWPYRV